MPSIWQTKPRLTPLNYHPSGGGTSPAHAATFQAQFEDADSQLTGELRGLELNRTLKAFKHSFCALASLKFDSQSELRAYFMGLHSITH